MFTPEQVLKISQYSDRIIDLVAHANEMTTSDLQGAADAIVMNILAAK